VRRALLVVGGDAFFGFRVIRGLKFSDSTRTTDERAGLSPSLAQFRSLLDEAFARTGKPVRLIGLGVRFASTEQDDTQLPLL
jgi:DNA polymerase-4